MGMANRLDDKDTEGHNGLPIQRRLAAEKERADYAWRNVRAIDAHRMAKEAEATAHIERQRAEIALLRHHLTELAKVADRAAMVLTTVRLMPCLDRLATTTSPARSRIHRRSVRVDVDVMPLAL